MHTSTPKDISKHIRKLVEKLAIGQEPVYLKVRPSNGAEVSECFPNVEKMISQAGGSMLCGWQIWEWSCVLVEAEFHAVWVSPEGELVEITPKQDGEENILFLPDPSMTYTGLRKDNVRLAVRDDLLVHHFIHVSEQIFKVINRGERSHQHSHVSVPAHEIGPLIGARNFLLQSISSGLRDHSPCMCGSGAKYKKCHARALAS